jgi:PAS domain S-box-containing protein
MSGAAPHAVWVKGAKRHPTIESELDDPRLMMAAIVDGSDDAIIGSTLAGVITSWNGGAERLYGYPADDVIGRSVAILMPPDQPDELGAILAQVAAGTRVDHYETTRIRRDGRLIEVSLTVSPIREADGSVVGVSSTARDITERKALKEALVASELRNVQAIATARIEEELSRSKDEVVSLVSHELRGPLASIVGFTELLYSRDLTEAQRKVYLGVMLREGRRLTTLINDVLHLQRLESGHQKLDLAPVDVQALMLRAVDAAGEDDQRPIGVIAPAPLPLVMVDADAMLQVLGNFLSNARKFSPEGGSVRMGARVVGKMVEIHIRDHGLGIPTDDLPNLFHRFYRVDSADRRTIRGTGLGLAINQKIIEAHGGHVEVHSDGLGKGSRFAFTLPLADRDSRSGEVLIVEDDAAFARLLEAEFTGAGLSSVRARDAETAEHLLLHMRPRAVVLDLMLPGIQGEEFLARLRAGRGPELLVVVLTLKELESAEILALQRAGVTAVLPKGAGAPQAAVTLIADALSTKAAASR